MPTRLAILTAAIGMLSALSPTASAASSVREVVGPMTISLPAAWLRSVDPSGPVNFVPEPAGTAAQSQYTFSKVDNAPAEQLAGHRLMWGAIKQNAGATGTERSGKSGRFEWSETTAQDRTTPRRTLGIRFYSTKEGNTHVCVVIVTMTPALLAERVATLEQILAAAQFSGAPAPTAVHPRNTAPTNDIPIVGSYIKVDVRFGGIGGSSTTTDHILLFANGIAVRLGVINGAIECYAALPVANLSTLPSNYGRWRDNKAANTIDIQWREGSPWLLKREGPLLSLDGKKLLALRSLESARLNGTYAYRPVGDKPSAIAFTPDGRFETLNLTDNMFCGGRAPPDGRGKYEVRKWTLILRYENGSVAMIPLHIRNEENLAAVKKFWVKSYEFEPVQ